MAIRSPHLHWLRSLASTLTTRRRVSTKPPTRRRIRLEQLESRYALTVPEAVDDGTPANPYATIEINSQDVQLNVALNDLDDLPNTELTVLVATSPSNGTLIADPNHSYAFLYTPTPGFTGADSFTYRVRDDDDQTSANEATVSLFVRPRAFAGLNQSLDEGGTLSLSSEANTEFSIPGSVGHGQLTYTWAIDPNIGNPFPISLPPGIFDSPNVIHTANPTLTWDDLADFGITNGNIPDAVVALKVVDENGHSDTDFTRLSVGHVNPVLTSFTITSLGCGTDVTLNASIFEANPNDQLEVFIDWDFLNFEDAEENLGAPVLTGLGPGGSGATYSITVPLHNYQAPGYVWPILRVVADGGDNGGFPETFDAENLGTVTNGVDNPEFGPDFPVFINVGAGSSAPTNVTITGAPETSPEGTLVNLGSSFSGGCGTPVFAWSVTKDGSSEPYATGSNANFGFTPDDDGSYVVSLTVDGVPADPQQTITVTNVDPVLTPVVGPSAGVRNQTLSFSSSFTDDGSADTHTTGWQVLDSMSAVVANGSGLSFDFTPTASGSYTVEFTVTDDDLGDDTILQAVTVSATLVQSGTLYVGGTAGADTFAFTPTGTPGQYTLVLNGVGQGTFSESAVQIFGGDAADAITINGDSGANSFAVNASSLALNGTTFNEHDVETRTINALGSGDTVTVNGGNAVVNGGSATDTLTMTSGTNDWHITANNGGSINSGQIVFTSIEHLVGGTGNDTFRFDDDFGVGNDVEGGGGMDTLDYSDYTTAVSVNLNSGSASHTGGISSIENVIGGLASDTLTAPNGVNTWLVGADSGSINSSAYTYQSFETLKGGTGVDTFQIQAGGGVTGTLNGGGGADVLDYSAYGSGVTVNLASSTSTAVADFTSIANFVGGSGTDTLIGKDVNSVWTITGGNAGTVGSTTFAGFESLHGGSANDTFRANGNSFLGGIAGGGGTDKLDYASYSTAVLVNLDPLDGLTTGFASVNDIENVAGGSAGDIIRGSSVANVIAGNGGNDIIVGGGGNDTINGNGGRDILVGGAGADFIFGNADEDILVAGTTTHDGSDAALSALMTEWSGGGSYTVRRNNVLAGAGLTGGVSLNNGETGTQTVFNDSDSDELTGNGGIDWFFANLDGSGEALDTVLDFNAAQEKWDDTDF